MPDMFYRNGMDKPMIDHIKAHCNMFLTGKLTVNVDLYSASL